MESFHRGRCFIMLWSKIKKAVRGALPEVALCIGLLTAVFAYAVPVRAQEQLADKLTPVSYTHRGEPFARVDD